MYSLSYDDNNNDDDDAAADVTMMINVIALRSHQIKAHQTD